MFIPVTLLGNDPDPIVHWYFVLPSVAKHVNVVVCARSAFFEDGYEIKVGVLTTNKQCQ